MLDPSMLDPNVFQAAQKAGITEIQDMNHNGKLDVQDVALMQANNMGAAVVAAPIEQFTSEVK